MRNSTYCIHLKRMTITMSIMQELQCPCLLTVIVILGGLFVLSHLVSVFCPGMGPLQGLVLLKSRAKGECG